MSPSTAPGRRAVVDVTGKIRRRRRRTWVRRALGALVALLVVGLVAAGVWLVGFSQVLASKRVTVTGATSLTAQQVTDVAQVPLGVPLARIDLRPPAQRVAALEQVAGVRARVVWPGTVELVVTERKAVFALASSDGYRQVDAGGQAYLRATKPLAGLPVARLADAPEPALLRDVATVVAALPPALRGATITAQTRDSITLALPQGITVVWGGAQDSELKAEVATKLMAAAKARVYDVSAPTRPTTR